MRRRRPGRDKRRTHGTLKTAPHDRHETPHAAWTRFWRVRQRRRVTPLWRTARGSAGRSCGNVGYMVSILSSGAVSFVNWEYPRWSCGPEVRACVVQTNPRAGLRQAPGFSRGVHDALPYDADARHYIKRLAYVIIRPYGFAPPAASPLWTKRGHRDGCRGVSPYAR